MNDLCIKNGLVRLGGRFVRADLAVKDGLVSGLGSDLGASAEVYDAEGKWVLPGLIDPHVHFHLGVGATVNADDFESGSRAAAFGGITTFIDFLDPVKTAAELRPAFEARLKLAEKGCLDYGFHSTLANPSSPAGDLLEASLDLGIPTVKLFTAYSSTGRRTGEAAIFSLLRAARPRGATILVHAENEAFMDLAPEVPVSRHEDSRPALCEINEVLQLAELVKQSGGRLYVVHTNCGTTLERLRAFYPELLGKSLFVESCPHYLLWSDRVYAEADGGLFTMAPPLRKEEERRKLEANFDLVDVLATDHCPYPKAAKTRPFTADIPMGIGGVEFSFVTMLNRFGQGVIERFTENPAKIHGLWPRKGNLQPGADADLCVFDPGVPRRLGQAEARGAGDYSCFEGIPALGRAEATLSRGRFVLRGGEFLGGKGRYLRRDPA